MRASYEWLKELTGISAPVDEIAQTLTSIGLEVEEVHEFRAPDRVVVARVESKKPHPEREKLTVVEVFDTDIALTARFGGEEFCVITDITQLRRFETLRGRIESLSISADDEELRCTMSIGVCVDDGPLDQMIAAADERLYAAKSGGRNQVVSS